MHLYYHMVTQQHDARWQRHSTCANESPAVQRGPQQRVDAIRPCAYVNTRYQVSSSRTTPRRWSQGEQVFNPVNVICAVGDGRTKLPIRNPPTHASDIQAKSEKEIKTHKT
jgi:hypothetical protein